MKHLGTTQLLKSHSLRASQDIHINTFLAYISSIRFHRPYKCIAEDLQTLVSLQAVSNVAPIKS